MRRLTTTLFAVAALVAVTACESSSTGPSQNLAPNAPSLSANAGTCTLVNGDDVPTGFDQFGYNYCAGLFNGPADGVDKLLDDMVWGDPTYANDHLVMKWNAAWDACKLYLTPEACADAWIDNEWNGKVNDGSGETWHYKIVWVGLPCDSTNPNWSDGGYCIWGSYEVILSQGTADGTHIWDVLAKPAGYGN